MRLSLLLAMYYIFDSSGDIILYKATYTSFECFIYYANLLPGFKAANCDCCKLTHTSCTGVFCQPFSSVPNEKCPGDDVRFRCRVTDPSGNGSARWTVTTPNGESSVCTTVSYDQPNTQQTCGPNGEFTSFHAGFIEKGLIYVSFLSVSEDFNGTTVECSDHDFNRVGTEDICILGKYL